MMLLKSATELKKIRLFVGDEEVGRIERLYIDINRWDVRNLLLRRGSLVSSERLLVSPPTMLNATFVNQRIHLDPEALERMTQIAVTTERSNPDDLIQTDTGLTVFGRRGAYSSFLASERITGYPVRTETGAKGIITDVAIDLIKWSVRYVVIRKSKWQFWRKTLIPPLWIGSINTDAGRLDVNLPKRAISRAPELASVARITPRFERRLVYHYSADEFKH
jgi:hypothetical protein